MAAWSAAPAVVAGSNSITWFLTKVTGKASAQAPAGPAQVTVPYPLPLAVGVPAGTVTCW
jgi:hypothetical protein